MPTRREDALLSVTMDMLENDNYQYEIQPKDDYDAFEDLERAGILNQTSFLQNLGHLFGLENCSMVG